MRVPDMRHSINQIHTLRIFSSFQKSSATEMEEQLRNIEASPRHRLMVYVIGCPGSGKGTLCKLLVQDYGYRHVSVGDLLRSLVDGSSEPNTDVVNHVQQGTLVPTAVLLNILERAIMPETRDSILVDGFPRRLDQGIASEEQFGKPDLVLFFNCNESVARDRYLTRKLEGRLTDNNEMFQRRYNEFTLLNRAVLEYYSGLGVLVTIDTNVETTISYQRLVAALKLDNERRESH